MIKKRYKIIKRTIAVSIVGLTATALLSQKDTKTMIAPPNPIEANELNSFSINLAEYENAEEIEFKNQELFFLVSANIDGYLTTSNIKEIKSLEITDQLSNQDLSDLKYLTNLKYLKIANNTVNLADLEYNQELCGLTLQNCTLSNTEQLPNSLEAIYLIKCHVEDYAFVTPYDLMFLELRYSPISSLKFKNTSSLQELKIMGNTYFSATDLVVCQKLYEMNLAYCSNLADAKALADITSLKYITLNEYASIWLDQETLEKLPTPKSTKKAVGEYILELDEIALQLATNNLSLEEKLSVISAYLLNKYDYDPRIDINNPDEALSKEYNLHPIKTSLESTDVVCINYASMFQALANRLDIDAVTVLNASHAWNAVNIDDEYQGVDITFLESEASSSEIILNGAGESLDSYLFDINDVHDQRVGATYPKDYENSSEYIGYIEPPEKINIQDILYNGIMYRLDNDLYSFKILGIGLAMTQVLFIITGRDKNNKKKKRQIKRKVLEN